MIGTEDFWVYEKDAPLLNRNANFFTRENAPEVMERAKILLDLIERTADESLDIGLVPECNDEAARRIFKLDAERTFKTEENRKKMILVLESLWPVLEDYHQGVGFLIAFLLLLLPPESVSKIIVGLHRHYIPGYFKAAPVAYVRDARVFQKLLLMFSPDVGAHTENLACPEAYVSKWFIGMNIHVLTFEAVLMFLEAFFERGHIFLFQYALALVKNCEKDIMETRDVSKVLAILRLDESVYGHTHCAQEDGSPGSFFTKIVEDGIAFDLNISMPGMPT